MKRFLLLAVLAACGKPNDIAVLHHEAVETAAYYQPQLDALDKRVQAIFKRGTTIPANLPGIQEVGAKLTEARDVLVQLRGIVQKGPDGKSAVEKQADLAAKDRNIGNLRKLVYDTERTLAEGTTVVRDDLYSVESWISLYDQGVNRPGGPMPEAPSEGGAPAPAPAPGNTTTPPNGNATGQPAPAAAGSGAAPAPAHP